MLFLFFKLKFDYICSKTAAEFELKNCSVEVVNFYFSLFIFFFCVW